MLAKLAKAFSGIEESFVPTSHLKQKTTVLGLLSLNTMKSRRLNSELEECGYLHLLCAGMENRQDVTSKA